MVHDRGRIAPRGARPSTGPEKRSAPRAGPRLDGVSRPPRAAASAESEGPSSPLTRRERACVGVGRCLIAADCAPHSFWGGGRRRASLPFYGALLVFNDDFHPTVFRSPFRVI